jgi:Ca2+-binding EF-hand superfamily protein
MGRRLTSRGFLNSCGKSSTSLKWTKKMFDAFKTFDFDKQGKGFYEVNEMRDVLEQYGEKLTSI